MIQANVTKVEFMVWAAIAMRVMPTKRPCGLDGIFENMASVDPAPGRAVDVPAHWLGTLVEAIDIIPPAQIGELEADSIEILRALWAKYHAKVEIELLTRRRRTATNLDGYFLGQPELDL